MGCCRASITNNSTEPGVVTGLITSGLAELGFLTMLMTSGVTQPGRATASIVGGIAKPGVLAWPIPLRDRRRRRRIAEPVFVWTGAIPEPGVASPVISLSLRVRRRVDHGWRRRARGIATLITSGITGQGFVISLVTGL